MAQFRQVFSCLLNRFPILQKLFGVGWKVILTETIIEIPFLILESSVLMRFLFGFTLGITFWQYVALAASLYLLIEAVRWAFARYIWKSNDYRLLKHERELWQILLNSITQLRRK